MMRIMSFLNSMHPDGEKNADLEMLRFLECRALRERSRESV